MIKEIKDRVSKLFGYENAKDDDMYYMKKKHIDWLISQAEKVERLERELEEYKLENQSLKGSVDIIERKRQELVKRLAEANEKIERYEKALKDIEQNSFEIFGAVRIAKQALENETI
jgi:predicted  nucleic acid-binding Zn-ribbon protein